MSPRLSPLAGKPVTDDLLIDIPRLIDAYYHERPDGIVGLVLVDSSHEQQRHRLPSGAEMEKMEAETAAMLGWCRRLAWMGAVRVLGAMEAAARMALDALRAGRTL